MNLRTSTIVAMIVIAIIYIISLCFLIPITISRYDRPSPFKTKWTVYLGGIIVLTLLAVAFMCGMSQYL